MNKYIILSKQIFTALYRFGQVPFNNLHLIATTEEDANFTSELYEHFKSIAFFNGDEEYLIVKLNGDEDYITTIYIENIIEIIPLTRAAKNAYELKFNQNITFSDPRFERLIYKVREYIEIEDKVKGVSIISEMLLPPHLTKEVISKDTIRNVYQTKVNGTRSYDIKDDFLIHLLVYDRYEFFPNTNLGYLYDVGEIFAHSKGAKSFRGSGLYNFLETHKQALISKKLLQIIPFIESRSEIDSFKNQLMVGDTKRYISALFYLKFKEDLLEKDSIHETQILVFIEWIIEKNQYVNELIEAVNLLGAFFGYSKFYDDYYLTLNLPFFKSKEKSAPKNLPLKKEKVNVTSEKTTPVVSEQTTPVTSKKTLNEAILEKIKALIGDKEIKVEKNVRSQLLEIIKSLSSSKITKTEQILNIITEEFPSIVIVNHKKKTIAIAPEATLFSIPNDKAS